MANVQMAIVGISVGAPPDQGPSVETARHHLEAARAALDAEIRAYPTPIAGCDAQYNHLLAQRRRVQAALRALAAEVHIPTPRAP